HVTDSAFVAVVGGSLLAHGKVPEADHGLGIAGSQCLLVRREAQAVDIAEVAQALAEFLSGACIPKAKGVIEAAARQDLTVQRERDLLHFAVMAFELAQLPIESQEFECLHNGHDSGPSSPGDGGQEIRAEVRIHRWRCVPEANYLIDARR